MGNLSLNPYYRRAEKEARDKRNQAMEDEANVRKGERAHQAQLAQQLARQSYGHQRGLAEQGYGHQRGLAEQAYGHKKGYAEHRMGLIKGFIDQYDIMNKFGPGAWGGEGGGGEGGQGGAYDALRSAQQTSNITQRGAARETGAAAQRNMVRAGVNMADPAQAAMAQSAGVQAQVGAERGIAESTMQTEREITNLSQQRDIAMRELNLRGMDSVFRLMIGL